MAEERTDKEWREMLDDESYHVMREKGTERPFTGKYDNFYEDGTYVCKGCGETLFLSDSKFSSGCGWPSFDQTPENSPVQTERDTSHGMIREEIICKNCGSHLGHVFNDGPTETGLRYCVNSVSLEFVKK